MPRHNPSSEPTNRERMKVESATIRHFLTLLRRHLDESNTLQDLLSGKESANYRAEDYQYERDELLQINDLGLKEGIIVGLVTFATLRFLPGIIQRRMMRRAQNTYTLDPLPSQQPQPSNKGVTTILWTARLGLDLFVSTVFAAYTSFLYTDENVMLQTASHIPLVAGRSIVSDELCPVVVPEYHSLHSEEFWKQAHSPYLRHLSTFVRNCEKRAAFEAELKEQQGTLSMIQQEEHIPIPFPGVPMDYQYQAEASSFSDTNVVGIDSDVLEYEDDDAWARSLVTDKEDDDKKRK